MKKVVWEEKQVIGQEIMQITVHSAMIILSEMRTQQRRKNRIQEDMYCIMALISGAISGNILYYRSCKVRK